MFDTEKLFGAPEGKKLFLWTKAKKALHTAQIFMTEDEKKAFNEGNRVINSVIDNLYEKRVQAGWKPNINDGVMEEIEGQAQIYIEENVPGYKQAFEKLDSLFGSAASDE